MSNLSPLHLEPIGVVRSPLSTAVGSPIQPRTASGIEGTIEISPSLEDGLRDLAGFTRIWVVYWFHLASPMRLVVTPYRDDREHGIFATRVPARPNPIGLSCVRLLQVRGHSLLVGDLDILDGTPVLDIKPYIPEYDSYPTERVGWLSDASKLDVRTGDGRFQVPR